MSVDAIAMSKPSVVPGLRIRITWTGRV